MNAVFAEGDEARVSMQSIDWSCTPLGPVEGWSHALRTMVGILLRSRFPMILWWGPKLVQIYNDAFFQTLGTKHPLAMGQEASACWPDGWDRIGPVIGMARSGRSATVSDDVRLLIDRDGVVEERHFKFACSLIPDETAAEDGIGGVLATVDETTQLVRAEHRLRAADQERARLLEREVAARREAERQKEHLFTLFMRVPTPIAILRGPEHVFELANPAMCRIWRRKPAELIDRPMFAALPELVEQGFRDIFDHIFITGTPFVEKEMAISLPHSEQRFEPRYFNVTWSPFSGVNGETEGILALNVDVTDEVMARAQVDELRREAESANRAKDEFMAMLSHELRNPLSPIVTALQLMRLQGKNSREQDVLERQVANLSRLVEDLMDVSRITRGKVQLRRQTIELAVVVESALEIVAPVLQERQQRADVRVASGLTVNVDGDRMAQVISNLLTNAAKYSERASSIVVEGVRAQNIVRLSVKDEGAGIDPALLDRVFDRFVQQPQTRGSSKGGVGLGLAIVRDLVELHGGTARAESAGLGKGSTFIIELPVPEHRLRAPI